MEPETSGEISKKKKVVNVIFEDKKLEKSYDALSDKDPIKKKIKKLIEEIKENPIYGRRIPERNISKEYKKKGFNNAFWVKINSSWRLIYSLTGTEAEILAIILDYFNHSKYERKFGYK